MIFGVPKWVQKGELISVVGGHGAPWAPKSVLGPESCISRPPKVTPRSDNRLKKGAKVVEKLSPNLARRTARSGLNPPPPFREERACFLTGTEHRNLRNLRGFRLSGGLPCGARFFIQIVQKWGSHFRPPFEHFWGP